jgi:hypothetical protein
VRRGCTRAAGRPAASGSAGTLPRACRQPGAPHSQPTSLTHASPPLQGNELINSQLDVRFGGARRKAGARAAAAGGHLLPVAARGPDAARPATPLQSTSAARWRAASSWTRRALRRSGTRCRRATGARQPQQRQQPGTALQQRWPGGTARRAGSMPLLHIAATLTPHPPPSAHKHTRKHTHKHTRHRRPPPPPTTAHHRPQGRVLPGRAAAVGLRGRAPQRRRRRAQPGAGVQPPPPGRALQRRQGERAGAGVRWDGVGCEGNGTGWECETAAPAAPAGHVPRPAACRCRPGGGP